MNTFSGSAFTFFTPTRIIFGEGTASGVADLEYELGASRPLIVTDKILREKQVLDPILDSLKDFQVPVFDEVPSDSDLNCVRQATELGKKHSCDSVIAVGGGSVIDTAKVVNIGLSTGADLLEYEGINILNSRLLPLIAIPTTAGTGSEVSAVAMIKDYRTSKKLLFGSRFLFADIAVLDPSLLLSLPPRLTAATGMDAVTHALEALVAIGSNPFTDSLAMQSLAFLFKYLPRSVKNGSDMEARAYTLVASTMAGVAFTNAGVGVVHALAHTVGAKYSVHHGIANAIFLPFGMELNMSAASERYSEVWNYLCTAFSGCSGADRHLSDKFVRKGDSEKAAQCLVLAIRDLMDECGLPRKLREVTVPEITDELARELSEISMTDPAIMFNPKEPSEDELIQILKGAY